MNDQKNVRLNYLYRDASNYKKWGAVIFSNPDVWSLEKIEEEPRACFEEDMYFIASQIDIPEVFLFINDYPFSDDDHFFMNMTRYKQPTKMLMIRESAPSKSLLNNVKSLGEKVGGLLKLNINTRHIKVACAIIENRGKVFAAQRSATMSLPLKWELPGGKIDEEESPEECLRRELSEELGIEVAAVQAMPQTTHHYQAFAITLYPFICEIISGTITL